MLNPGLRLLLAIIITVVATVPVMLLGFWVEKTAMEKELAAVSEKHLLLAKNITAALDRYALDTKAAFTFFTQSADPDRPSEAAKELARKLSLRHFCIIDDEGRVTFQLNVSDEVEDRLPTQILNRLRPAFDNPDATFSSVMPDAKGRPTIFLTLRLGPNRIAIGALDLEYIRQVQKAIIFGRKGHSAIVDGAGNLIAHPNPQWQRQMKKIAKVKPVAKMMAGETGVTQFYSPAVKKDMITGFTTVPSTGWGVMVPQPLEELEERAGDVNRVALTIIVAGLLTAALISWILSGLLVRPVRAVVNAAREIAGGKLESRVSSQSKLVPREFRELGTSFNAMARDITALITEREHAEAELAHHQKLESLSHLAGGIAHNLNNLLQPILVLTDMVRKRTPKESKNYEDLGVILTAGERAHDIVNRIMVVSYMDDLPLKEVDAYEVVRQSLDLLKSSIPSTITLVEDLDQDTGIIHADSAQTQSVLLNLASNAIDAIDGQVGELKVSLGRSVVDRSTASRIRGLNEGVYAKISVSDNGCGMDDLTMARAFNPFFTTKGIGQGTGLGLATVNGIIRKQNGAVAVSSEINKGSTFDVYLPLIEEEGS